MGSSISFDSENFGKLFIRLFLGIFFMANGMHFFAHGHRDLVVLGTILKMVKISFSPIFSCWVLAIVNVICGITLIIGFLFRTSCFLLSLTSLLEAAIAILANRGALNSAIPTLTISMVILGLMFIGKGKFSAKN